ncbi:MFS transporter [Propionivibrio limicola]|uniref:MFS transporter n=1 Tax=Propionivibrio limicola TaxID=167645 RepID=UPI001291CC56|nr:MFS transporter [Propionivibrio limicola]
MPIIHPQDFYRAQARKAAWASWIGSALEYYDFFLYATAAALVLGPLYFPASEPGLTALVTLASVGVGYISRPVGALLLGPLGDLLGRRLVLSITLLLMGSATFLIGILPTYQEIGIAAPIALVVLRLLQGFAASGEHAGASTLVLELIGTNKRGLYTSFALSGTLAGLIAASMAFLLVSTLLTEEDLLAWGWRIPFQLSAIVVAAGVWVRFRLPESPAFLSEKRTDSDRSGPLKYLWRYCKTEILRVVLAAQVSVVSSIVGVFSLSWAVNHLHISRPTMLGITLSSASVGVFAVPALAYLSDRIGRKPVFIFGAMGSGILIWPYLWALGQMNIPLAFLFGILLAGVAYSAANGVWPSLYSEMFSTKVRLSGMAISTQIGFTLAAQAPAVAAVLTRYDPSDWMPVALLVTVSCAISIAAVCTATETSRIELSELGRK